MRIVDDRVVSKMFGPKTDDKTGDWRKLHTEERHVLYSSPTITQVIKSRRMRWAGHVTRIGEKKGAYRILVQKREGERERLHGRRRRRWMDNIKMDLKNRLGGRGLIWLRI